jgi:hypothetical protein
MNVLEEKAQILHAEVDNAFSGFVTEIATLLGLKVITVESLADLHAAATEGLLSDIRLAILTDYLTNGPELTQAETGEQVFVALQQMGITPDIITISSSNMDLALENTGESTSRFSKLTLRGRELKNEIKKRLIE